MTIVNWKMCIIISLATAFVGAFLSMTVITIVEDNVEMIDLARIDNDKLDAMNEMELNNYIGSLPTKKLSGIERFTYQFTHPQALQFYLNNVFTLFIYLLFSTSLVSYLHNKETNA